MSTAAHRLGLRVAGSKLAVALRDLPQLRQRTLLGRHLQRRTEGDVFRRGCSARIRSASIGWQHWQDAFLLGAIHICCGIVFPPKRALCANSQLPGWAAAHPISAVQANQCAWWLILQPASCDVPGCQTGEHGNEISLAAVVRRHRGARGRRCRRRGSGRRARSGRPSRSTGPRRG